MTSGAFFGVMPLLLGLLGVQPGIVAQSVTRLIVQDEIILRVPVRPRPLIPEIEWIEKKGPKCIPAATLQGAMLSGPQQVDFVQVNHTRVRAQLDENCPALDFYRGFYLQVQDGQICVHRDAILSRIGGSCTIDRFKQLVPRLRH